MLSSTWQNHPIWQKRWFVWPLIAISALLTPFTFAPYRLFWLMPILLMVLFTTISLCPKNKIGIAYVWGLLAYSAQCYWINIALHDVSGLPQLYALPLTFLLPAYLAIYPAITFWLLEKFKLNLAWRLIVVLPLLWTLSEFIRERALTGFGWGALGYSQIAESPLAGFAPVGGITLVTLSVACVASWLSYAFLSRDFRNGVVAVCATAVLYAVGFHLQSIVFTTPDGSLAEVALAQGNIEQVLKWNEEQIEPTIERYWQQVENTEADIMILPETALPSMKQWLPVGTLNQFANSAQRKNMSLAIGIPQFTNDGENYLNSVISLDKVDLSKIEPLEIQDLPTYSKNHLVPFGEYIPLPSLTGWLYQAMNMPLSGFHAGGENQKPLVLGNQKVAFNICYEDGFGDELIDSAKNASLLANVSNMAWYGNSAAMDLHLQQSQARALELGRYMVRATNTGQTAIIAPNGKIDALAPRDVAMVLTGTIAGYQGETPYMKMGSSWPLAYVFLSVLLALYSYSLFCKHKTRRPE